MLSTVYATCLLASAALASPVALAPRYYINNNDYARTTDVGHQDGTSISPAGGIRYVNDHSNDASRANSNTAWGPDGYPFYPTMDPINNPGFIPGTHNALLPGSFPDGYQRYPTMDPINNPGFIPGTHNALLPGSFPDGLTRLNGIPSTRPLIGDPSQILGATQPGLGSAVFKN
ncbi:hypothetical protein MJO28_009965 [Puccinia striiformis f. sp. tritici]|uniref:Uncharacterized protein n=1 Tax=Puccinia striiformis f. sp. tritici TaxID=168172 RepID=A0ACC0E950_9BASI|nr:hypothetical protein Pst134EA_017211 [Puccinia striiformis f. sp. tritici]KAH9460899.1 hypothetical protein Pst134EA_017211 [Puccinia striiformis f. sp. tritici]KAI7948057.1 hypothetical protein MJO28_009965 [Puccinia striiformis f. sp. tritici]